MLTSSDSQVKVTETDAKASLAGPSEMLSGDESIPVGSGLVVGYGTSVNFTMKAPLGMAYFDLFGPTSSVAVVEAPTKPVAPTKPEKPATNVGEEPVKPAAPTKPIELPMDQAPAEPALSDTPEEPTLQEEPSEPIAGKLPTEPILLDTLENVQVDDLKQEPTPTPKAEPAPKPQTFAQTGAALGLPIIGAIAIAGTGVLGIFNRKKR